MEGLRNTGAYGALANSGRAEGSASILRRAVETAKSEQSEKSEQVPGREGDLEHGEVSAETLEAPRRPIGNLGQHLDLQL